MLFLCALCDLGVLCVNSGDFYLAYCPIPAILFPA
jgi:hypothetical protein